MIKINRLEYFLAVERKMKAKIKLVFGLEWRKTSEDEWKSAILGEPDSGCDFRYAYQINGQELYLYAYRFDKAFQPWHNEPKEEVEYAPMDIDITVNNLTHMLLNDFASMFLSPYDDYKDEKRKVE